MGSPASALWQQQQPEAPPPQWLAGAAVSAAQLLLDWRAACHDMAMQSPADGTLDYLLLWEEQLAGSLA